MIHCAVKNPRARFLDSSLKCVGISDLYMFDYIRVQRKMFFKNLRLMLPFEALQKRVSYLLVPTGIQDYKQSPTRLRASFERKNFRSPLCKLRHSEERIQNRTSHQLPLQVGANPDTQFSAKTSWWRVRVAARQK